MSASRSWLRSDVEGFREAALRLGDVGGDWQRGFSLFEVVAWSGSIRWSSTRTTRIGSRGSARTWRASTSWKSDAGKRRAHNLRDPADVFGEADVLAGSRRGLEQSGASLATSISVIPAAVWTQLATTMSRSQAFGPPQPWSVMGAIPDIEVAKRLARLGNTPEWRWRPRDVGRGGDEPGRDESTSSNGERVTSTLKEIDGYLTRLGTEYSRLVRCRWATAIRTSAVRLGRDLPPRLHSGIGVVRRVWAGLPEAELLRPCSVREGSPVDARIVRATGQNYDAQHQQRRGGC